MIKKTIPQELSQFIDTYFNLDIHGIKVICPYYINKGSFLSKPVFTGKGTSSQIQEYANKLISKEITDPEIIRTEMIKDGLGIDCSGLTYQMYDKWLEILYHGSVQLNNFLPKIPWFRFWKRIPRKFKPECTFNAAAFTSSPFAKKIELKDIAPGDLIRTRGGKHVLFICEVEYDDNGIPVYIRFVHSTNKYKRSGVRFEEIQISSDLDLINSTWKNNDTTEKQNETYKGYRILINNNGIFHPNLPLNTN